MKKLFFSMSFLLAAAVTAQAQDKKMEVATPQVSSNLKPENLAFQDESHDFGNVDEGAPAEFVFKFKNTGKEPVIIERVQPSCGCTTPDWSKEPIAPGKTGLVKASYGTQGRPGHFDKTLTVFSNAGTRVLTIKGDVAKAPETSVPQNNSLMRTN